jgi:hypothetical protein
MDFDDDASSIDSNVDVGQGLEEQFVLRVPPHIADSLRARIRSANHHLPGVSISIDGTTAAAAATTTTTAIW